VLGSTALGILHKGEGVPLRATFIVDPEGVIRFARVLDALQTGELCPCNWQAGEPTQKVA
jgi:alkyl hydroperoxide reductase subunit AhpC